MKWSYKKIFGAIVALAAVLLFTLWLLLWGGLKTMQNSISKITGGALPAATPGAGGTPYTPNPNAVFPVSVNSAPADVLEAFVASGYIQAQKSAGASQAYINNIYSNPLGELAAHPYVYSSYPAYFISQ